jgi:arylsulfatase A-like enzyme
MLKTTILLENGYNTAWFGKMHNVPDLDVESGGAV